MLCNFLETTNNSIKETGNKELTNKDASDTESKKKEVICIKDDIRNLSRTYRFRKSVKSQRNRFRKKRQQTLSETSKIIRQI